MLDALISIVEVISAELKNIKPNKVLQFKMRITKGKTTTISLGGYGFKAKNGRKKIIVKKGNFLEAKKSALENNSEEAKVFSVFFERMSGKGTRKKCWEKKGYGHNLSELLAELKDGEDNQSEECGYED